MITTGFSFYLDRERDPGTTPRHKHDCYELILYLSGSGVATVDGQDYPFSPGSLALVPPEVPHNDRYDSPTQVWCLGFFSDNAIPATVIGTDSDDFSTVFAQIGREWLRGDAGGIRIIGYLTEILVLRFLRLTSPPEEDSSADRRIRYTAQYIRSNLSEGVDFRKLAADIGYSYDRFRHLFTETIGQSPKQYLLAARFEEAKRLLRNTDGKISGIAADCGFGQSAQFVAAFRKAIGMTPTEYRARKRLETNL